jgi:protein-S-isoprenylcysteine O-methyltransferase Ste14
VVLLLGVGLLVAATAALLGPWIGAALAGIALVLTGLFLISIPDEETK